MERLLDYAINNDFDRPTVILDIDQVEKNYHELKAGMSAAHIHYAVKANPQPEILSRLVSLGCRFDAASIGEIEMCLAAGAQPQHISFGNTIKRVSDIQKAHAYGITLFSADAAEELDKIAQHAPGANVFIRIIVTNSQAEWPLSRKFGCNPDYAVLLMDHAASIGLGVAGLSFHVGSQTRHPEMWFDTLDMISGIWAAGQAAGHPLWLLNVGGGFPAYYGVDVTPPEEYGAAIMAAIHERFSGVKYVMAEPGRGLVANAGVIACTVLLVSRKSPSDNTRWVYLDIGRFSGLSETESEAIKYQFEIPGKHNQVTGACVMAGPTCDSADILYEVNKVQLPLDLQAGDKFIIKSTGAYTTTYSTVAFNGFPPLQVTII